MPRRLLLFALPILLLALAACAPVAGQPGPTNAPAATAPPSATPTTPSTITPTALATVTPTSPPTATFTAAAPPSTTAARPCVIVVRTPPPSAPTETGGQATPPRQIDPHIELCASATTLKVGQSVTVLGQAVDIGLPYFNVLLQDEGAPKSALLAQVTFENQVKSQADVSRVLALVSIEAHNNNLVVSLSARGAGRTSIMVAASGEVHYGYPGPATWSGGGSDPLTLTVTP